MKFVGPKVRDVVPYTGATSSFGMKFRIGKVRRERIVVAVSSLRNLSFSEGKKIRLKGEYVMLRVM